LLEQIHIKQRITTSSSDSSTSTISIETTINNDSTFDSSESSAESFNDIIINANNIIANAAIDLMLDCNVEENLKVHGSLSGKAPNKNRNFQMAYDRLIADFFQELIRFIDVVTM
jgi:hypothetical protein